MSRKTSNRLPRAKEGQGPSVFDRIVQWNGGILPVTYDDLFRICEREMADKKRQVGPSFSDRLIEWNSGVLPDTYEDAVAICQRVRGEFERGLIPGVGYIAVEGAHGRTRGVSTQPASNNDTAPVLRRISTRIGQDTANEGSISTSQTPKTDTESKSPLATPFPPFKPKPLQSSCQSILWPTPSMEGSPVLSPGIVLLPNSLHDHSSASHVLNEFDAAASDVLSGYTNLTGASSGFLRAFRNFRNEEAKEDEEEWNPLEEIDMMIMALREVEGKEAAARDREERIRETVRQRRDRQASQGRSWHWGKRCGGG